MINCTIKILLFFFFAAIASLNALSITFANEKSVLLKNEYIHVNFQYKNNNWLLTELSRIDGTDKIQIENDGFEILLISGERFTAIDYQSEIELDLGNEIVITYNRLPLTKSIAPTKVLVRYIIKEESWLHKEIQIPLNKNDFIDRLQVFRFSTKIKAERGGQGQPVFIGNWFLGLDYPGFHSWHADGFTEPNYFYRHPYDIDYKGKTDELNSRNGLVTCFHFPGYSKKQTSNFYEINSKRGVIGISKKPKQNAEIALLEYIEKTRKITRSHTHFNNWYSTEAKDITIENTINSVFLPMKNKLNFYGAKMDAFCPDHGWEKSRDYSRIFEPKIDEKHDSLIAIRKVLEENGTRLGIWVALDGTNQDHEFGLEFGYKSGLSKDFEKTKRWHNGKQWFNILDEKYQSDLKQSLKYLLKDVNVDYIKHDFNHNFTSDYITERHAREACLDFTLELLEFERSLNSEIFQNYTNGVWFSPWWLQVVDAIWMMSGDSGNFNERPQLSLRDKATSYRDYYFFENFNNPDSCIRPVIPIANFMTHGILYSTRKPFTDGNDRLEDWTNYLAMYLGRGTTLKELYISPKLLNDEEWKALGLALNWAQLNQDNLMNTVFIGGNVKYGEPYGYVSWNNDKAILTVRNPDRMPQKMIIPFNQNVYYRGETRLSFHARAIYPFVEEMSWNIVSGEDFEIEIPGDRVMIFEIMQGKANSKEHLIAKELPHFESSVADDKYNLQLTIPDDDFQRYDLLVQTNTLAYPVLKINEKDIFPNRFAPDKKWALANFDLMVYKGKTIKIEGQILKTKDSVIVVEEIEFDVFLVADRKVSNEKTGQNPNLPLSVSPNYRRQNQHLIKSEKIISKVVGELPLEIKN